MPTPAQLDGPAYGWLAGGYLARFGLAPAVGKTRTLTFAPGETTKAIAIVVNGDSKQEADEYFYLELFGLSSNVLFTKIRATSTILKDD